MIIYDITSDSKIEENKYLLSTSNKFIKVLIILQSMIRLISYNFKFLISSVV